MARWTSSVTQDLKWAGYRFTGAAGTIFSIADEHKASFVNDPGPTIAGLTWTDTLPASPATGQVEWRDTEKAWYYYSGTAWIPTAPTHVNPPYEVVGTSTQNTTTSYADVTNCTSAFTPAVPEIVKVTCSFLASASASSGTFFGVLVVDGTPQTREARWNTGVSGLLETVTIQYIVSLTAAAHTLKLQVKHTTNAFAVTNTFCSMIIERFVQ